VLERASLHTAPPRQEQSDVRQIAANQTTEQVAGSATAQGGTHILEPRPWTRLGLSVQKDNSFGGKTARRVLPLLIFVAVAAVVALFILASKNSIGNRSELGLVAVLAALAALSEMVGFNKGRSTVGSVGLVPITASLLVAPSWVTVVLAVAGQSLAFAVQRRDAIKILYNAAQACLSLSLGALVYLGLSSPETRVLANVGFVTAGLSVAIPTTLLVLVTWAVNSVLIGAVVSLTTATQFRVVLRRVAQSTTLLTLLLAIFAFYLAWLSVNLGIVGTAGMVLPLIAVRQLYRSTIELSSVTEELLDLMVAAIEARDPYTSGHSKRVANTSTILAKAIGLTNAQVERVTVAALLHDVGKIDEAFAPILAKEGRLTPEEWAVMKKHPVRSAELVAMLTSLRDVVGPVRHHHENWDGTGYPDGLKGEAIPLTSRIIMFADTLDAITTDRPYRRALGMEDARSEFVKFKGKQFDPNLCEIVLRADVWAQLYTSIDQHETKLAERKVS
jgi:putative nucleotidyltransferase with HDIG domain